MRLSRNVRSSSGRKMSDRKLDSSRRAKGVCWGISALSTGMSPHDESREIASALKLWWDFEQCQKEIYLPVVFCQLKSRKMAPFRIFLTKWLNSFSLIPARESSLSGNSIFRRERNTNIGALIPKSEAFCLWASRRCSLFAHRLKSWEHSRTSVRLITLASIGGRCSVPYGKKHGNMPPSIRVFSRGDLGASCTMHQH